ncbi:MAG TPA: ATP-binding cassette domain-containing protein [Thermomicrobiales bacterium]|nr:ATP-binding cassette domain-containing protein [Thermomicrobiales bacterium]
MSAPAISATNLTKTYTFHQQGAGLLSALKGVVKRRTETRLAVDAIDLAIQPGEIVGLLGPNGAGKTTTLKMLSGLLYPTSGHLDVLGFVPSKRDVEYLRRIALVMGQKSFLWWDVPAMDSFLLHKDMYDIPDREFRDSIDELASMLDVGHLLDVQVRKTSLGERMKLELMAALIHRPEIVFLDEPTIGLDVVAKARVRDFLREINRAHGTTIVITSHDMDDIEALCHRVMIVNHGRIEYDGDLSRLVHTIQPGKRVRVTYVDAVASLNALDDIVSRTTDDDGRVWQLDVPRDRLNDVLETLPRLGAMIDLEVADADVEEIIRDLFTREVRHA